MRASLNLRIEPHVGKRRFEEGVRRYHERGGDRTVEVEYHSFELAPDTPVDFQGSEVDFLAGYKGYRWRRCARCSHR